MDELRGVTANTQRAARLREAALRQQRDHWIHHIRATLGEFMPDAVRSPRHSRRRRQRHGSSSSSRRGRRDDQELDEDEHEGGSDSADDDEAHAELMDLLRRLPSLRQWFVDQVG